MPTMDIAGRETEYICTTYTTIVYEQAFHDDRYEKVTGDLIADVMRVVKVSADDIVSADESGNLTVTYNYTYDNWQAYLRALWAMVRTAAEIRRTSGQPAVMVPSYQEWAKSLVAWEPDMHEVSNAVCNELQRGLFRAGADVPQETIQGKE